MNNLIINNTLNIGQVHLSIIKFIVFDAVDKNNLIFKGMDKHPGLQKCGGVTRPQLF